MTEQAAAPKGKRGKAGPVPVRIVEPPKSIPQRAAGVTRLGTPAAFIMLAGLLLVYYSLRGWDRKYRTFSGTFAGKGSVPSGTRERIQ